MKNIFFILLFYPLFSFSQNENKYRLEKTDFEELNKINEEIATKVGWIQEFLNINWRDIEKKNEKLMQPDFSGFEDLFSHLNENQKKKVSKIVCILCFKEEYENQKKLNEISLQKEKRKLDSINDVKYKKYEETIKTSENNYLKKVKDTTQIQQKNTENPYDILSRSLTTFSDNRNFTVFRKIDYNYAYTRLTSYLQTDFSLTESNPTFSETQIIHRFVPKVSSGNEYINIFFNVEKHNNIIGYYTFLDDVFIINNVTIKGTPDLIISLFIDYWKDEIKLEDIKGKTGIVASKNILGDFVLLKIINQNLLEIEIKKGNMDVDYESTFGINKIK